MNRDKMTDKSHTAVQLHTPMQISEAVYVFKLIDLFANSIL